MLLMISIIVVLISHLVFHVLRFPDVVSYVGAIAAGSCLYSWMQRRTREKNGLAAQHRQAVTQQGFWWGAAFMLAVVPTASGVASQSLGTVHPALPALALDNLPAPVRTGFERAYRKARAHPDDPAVVGNLGMMLHAHEQYRSAEACYRIARTLAPTALSWAYLIGVSQAEVSDHAGAVRSFRAALTIDPAYLSARVRLADALMAADDLDASLDEYTTLVRDFPELAIAHYGLGRLSSIRGDPKAAAAHYRRAVDMSPQFGVAHYALALAYRDVGLDDLAERHVEAFRRWGARRPVPPDPLLEEVRSLKATARDLVAEAAQLGGTGRLEESIALHLKAIEADPTAAQAHVNLISLYGRLGRSDQAEQHYRAALRLESSLGDAHYNYGVLLTSARRAHEASDAFRRALEVNPFHAQAHNNLATLLAGQGRLDEAVAHYRHAVANDPGHRGARFNLGRALIALGRPREAAEQFERLLLPEDADTPRYMYALANAWFAANELAKARECGGQALQRARALGQTELAARIEQELIRMTTVR